MTFLNIFNFNILCFNILYVRQILEEERSMSFCLYSYINNVRRKGTSKHKKIT